jgi:rare lipoprotein A
MSVRGLLFVALVFLSACGTTRPDQWWEGPDGKDHAMVGKASWYGDRFEGRKTASGEPFHMREFTAAHRTLPFGTVVRVVEEETRKKVVVRINDRGPFTKGRVIDLSKAAAEDLGMIRAGVVSVYLEILEWPEK